MVPLIALGVAVMSALPVAAVIGARAAKDNPPTPFNPAPPTNQTALLLLAAGGLYIYGKGKKWI